MKMRSGNCDPVRKMICSRISICHLFWSLTFFPTVRITSPLVKIAFYSRRSVWRTVMSFWNRCPFAFHKRSLQLHQSLIKFVTPKVVVETSKGLNFLLCSEPHSNRAISCESLFIRCILMVCVFYGHCRVCCTDDRRQRWWLTCIQRHLYSRSPWNINFWHPVDQTLRGLWITSYIWRQSFLSVFRSSTVHQCWSSGSDYVDWIVKMWSESVRPRNALHACQARVDQLSYNRMHWSDQVLCFCFWWFCLNLFHVFVFPLLNHHLIFSVV